jgi:eukaryotic-like serine/threonine-protein kinase
MSAPDDKDSHQSDSYITWLEACDKAIALGRSSLEQPSTDEFPAEDNETLDILRRLDRLRGAAGIGEDVAIGDDGIFSAVVDAIKPPRDFGDYEFLETIAAGGMGIVFRARQSSLDRIVAVKMIRLGPEATTSDRRRFLREAEAVAKLDHPNIVPVHEVGQVGELPFFSMKLMEGGSLERALGRLLDDPRSAVRMGIPIAQAVHHAHQHGILHRDLKPANVLLDAEGRPYVTDFGLARPIDGDSTLTQQGSVVGTPSYMAPEQARASPGNATIAADVYGLGAILYALFTGRPPFKANTPVETLRQVIDHEPPSPRAINSKIDRDLEAICLKALDKEPKRRYSSASALAEDLERWLAGKPIRARRIGRPERIWKWAKRRPAIAMLSGLLVFVALGGLIGMFVLYGQAVTARAVAVAQTSKAVEALRNSEASLYSNQIALAERYRLAHDTARAEQLLDECPDLLRDWEWRYLKRRLVEDVRVYRGHDALVSSIAFSPDDRYLVSQDDIGNIHVRDRTTGRVSDLATFPSSESAVVISPDGRWLASGGSHGPKSAGAIKLWNTKTWTEFKSLTDVGSYPHALAFSPDSRRLVGGHDDDAVRIWDIATETVRALTGHRKAVEDVAFSPDGHLIASASRDTTIRLWDTETGALRATLPHERGVYGLAFHPRGRLLASVTGDVMDSSQGELILWNVDSARVVKKAPALAAMAFRVCFSPDGRRLATAGVDRLVRIWDSHSLNEMLPLTGHTGPVRCVAFSHDGNQVVSGGDDDGLRCWSGSLLPERPHRQPLLTFSGHDHTVLALALTPDSRRVISAGDDRTARVWDVETGPKLLTYRKHEYAINALAIRPDGKAVATAGDDNDSAIRIWHPETGAELGQLRGHTLPVTALAFHRDGVRLASASQDGTVRLWNTHTGGQIHQFIRTGNWMQTVAFSPNGVRLAASGEAGDIYLWETESRQQLHTLRGHTLRVVALAFHSDSDQLLSASLDGTVRHWESLSGHEIRLFAGMRGRGLAWSPDGRHFAMSGAGGSLKFWNVLSGQCVLTLQDHAGDITSAMYSSDGRRIVTTGWDRTVKLWDTRPDTSELWVGESQRLIGHPSRCSVVALLPDGKRAISGGEDGTIRVWDIASECEIRRWIGSDFKVTRLVVTPDGERVVVAGENSDIRVYDIESGRALHRFNHQHGAIFGLAVTPDGRQALTSGPLLLATMGWRSGTDVDLHLWDIENGLEIRRFSGHRDGITSVAISPDGRRAVSGSMDGTIRAWDLATGGEVRCFEAQMGPVSAVGFLPDGNHVLSGGSDHGLCLWDIESGREIRRFNGPGGPVGALAIAPDGRHALSSGVWDHQLRLWRIDSGRELYRYEIHNVLLTRGAFTPDGRQALWAGVDGVVRVWDVPRHFNQEQEARRSP